MLKVWNQSVSHLVLPRALWPGSVPGFSPWRADDFLLEFFSRRFPFRHFCLSVPIYPYKDTSHTALGPTLMTSSVLNYIFKTLFPNDVKFWAMRGWKCQNTNEGQSGHHSIHNKEYTLDVTVAYQGGFFTGSQCEMAFIWPRTVARAEIQTDRCGHPEEEQCF